MKNKEEIRVKDAPEKETEKAPETAEPAAEAAAEAAEQAAEACEGAPEAEKQKEPSEADKLKSELADTQDKYRRMLAEYDNFRKRSARERESLYADASADTVAGLLPVLDNLERALQAESEDEKLKAGVEMIYKQFCGALEKRGVTAIDRKGEKFDPRLENAVMQADSSQGEPGTVCQVLQKGYRMGDVVLRHAMVQVVEE